MRRKKLLKRFIIGALFLLYCWLGKDGSAQNTVNINTGQASWTVTPTNKPTISAVLANPYPSNVNEWIPNTPLSQWIAPSANQWNGNPPGSYLYATTFAVNDPTSTTCKGKFAADDMGIVQLNGVRQATDVYAFRQWTEFVLNDLKAGLNNLTIQVINYGTSASATGLRLEIACAVKPTGIPGPPGPIGPTGPQGPQGIQGAPGPAGSGTGAVVDHAHTAHFVPMAFQSDGSWFGWIEDSRGDPPLFYIVNKGVETQFSIAEGQFVQGQGWPLTVKPNGTPWPKDATVTGVVIY